jgi:hypothetical protein
MSGYRADMADLAPKPRLTPAQQADAVRRAWEIQGERDAEVEARADRDAFERAHAELGLDPALLARAEDEIRAAAAQAAAAAATQRRRLTRVALAAAGIVGFLGAGAALWAATRPAPFQATTLTFSDAWALEVNPGTAARVARVPEDGHGEVAHVVVERFAAGADGRSWANYDGPGLDLTGAGEITIDARADGLQNIRIYLEDGDVRWRGPVMAVGPEWSTHRAPLTMFERQERDGAWVTRGAAPPAEVDRVSVKLGWYVNDVGATGEVWLSKPSVAP